MNKTKLPLLFLIPALLLGGIFGLVTAKPDRPDVKVKVKRLKKKKVVPGETAMLRVKLKNRTKEEQRVTLELFCDDDEIPFAEEELTLARKEKRKLEVACPVPEDFNEDRLEVTARVKARDESDEEDEDEDETKIPVKPAPNEGDKEWLRGKELYTANCAACHALNDKELRGEDLGDWLEAVREGEDDMPAFPNLDRDDVVAMRTYFEDPERVVDPGPGDPPPELVTYENSVKSIFDTSCVACHRSGNARGNIQADNYAEAFKNRVVLVDSVVKERMPTGGPLSQEKKDLLTQWLTDGAQEK